MEASALRAPAGISRLSISVPLLRLRSDDQLLALFRAGSDEAFNVLHDRYRQRLFAYVRQMLSAQSRQDAEDVLQDVFVRAFGALRADERAVNVRAWLYRVAHNRCIDHLRRPMPAPADIFEMSRTPLHDPIEDAQRREDLQRLVTDVGRLPEQQRSALLMREIDGMSYADLATALDVTVPAVKSLLVRARLGLVEAAEARGTDCAVIREDLVAAYDRGVKASGRARRHMRECSGCREYRTALRSVRSSFAALTPRRRRRGGAGGEALRHRRRRGRRGQRGRRRRRRDRRRLGRRGRRHRVQGRRRRVHRRADRGRRRRGQEHRRPPPRPGARARRRSAPRPPPAPTQRPAALSSAAAAAPAAARARPPPSTRPRGADARPSRPPRRQRRRSRPRRSRSTRRPASAARPRPRTSTRSPAASPPRPSRRSPPTRCTSDPAAPLAPETAPPATGEGTEPAHRRDRAAPAPPGEPPPRRRRSRRPPPSR